MSAALIIFVKNLAQGKVKTRLAKSIGEVKALKVYQYLLIKTMENTEELDCEKYVYYDEHLPTNDDWSSAIYTKKMQVGEHLGEKLSNAMIDLFENEEYKKVIFIQPDCPKLTQNILNKAITALDSSDVVIGQTEDNGYYLLGSKGYFPEMFDDMNYDNATNYDFILQNLQKMNKSIAQLPILKDVDVEEDLSDDIKKFLAK